MTLIVSKSGTLHGTDEHDWKWWHEQVPIKLGKLHREGHQIVIVSNQGRLTKNGKEAPEAQLFKRKMELVMKELGIPTIVMVACANDICRKPRVGMWSLLGGLLRSTNIVASQSFVVGDAAGREKDYSDIDRHFAMNLGIGFYTPETLFIDEPPEELGHKFDPSWNLSGSRRNEHPIIDIRDPWPPSRIIMLVGLPGAGKTTYYHHSLMDSGYHRVAPAAWSDQGTCIDDVHKLLAEGKSFFATLDDINIDAKSRKEWLAVAQEHDLRIIAMRFTASTELCLHNDSFRALAGTQYNPEQRPIYPRLPFLGLVSTYERPTTSEGFQQIIDVEFEVSLNLTQHAL
ncbi:polynucleotide kinase 3 phosphatase-domain-containing protein [Annulohypoxylon bovei var. microspora]|nr:polynucleotide kinase 3 phosphatase-domain-containing protein [Annulohypoxylon bovei var. microspora]